MRKVKVKHNSLCIYLQQSSSKCVGKCIMKSFLACYRTPQNVNITLILNTMQYWH